MLAAYRSTECFLRLTPAMAMPDLPRQRAIAPVCAIGNDRRSLLRERLTCSPQEKLVLIAFGGFDKDLRLEHWPQRENLRWLIPQSWPIRRADMAAFEPLELPFTDLLCSVDAVLTKPGYGTFTEAACNGVPVLYVRRDNWPEQDCLITWLRENVRCAEISETELASGQLGGALDSLWQLAIVARPRPDGALEAANYLAERLGRL